MVTRCHCPTTLLPSGLGLVCGVLAPLILGVAAVAPSRVGDRAAVAPLHVRAAMLVREALPAWDPATPPLRFEPNEGQADLGVRFVAHGPGYTLLLTTTGATWVSTVTPTGGVAPMSQVTRLGVVGVRTGAHLVPESRLPGVSNYFLGSDPRCWRVGVPGYARVVERGVLPGVDVIYDGAGGKLAVRLLLHPGANRSRLRLAGETDVLNSIAGLHAPGIAGSAPPWPARLQGTVWTMAAGENDDNVAPAWGGLAASQTVGPRVVAVPAALVAQAGGTVGLAVGPYDRRQALLISVPLAADAAHASSLTRPTAVGHGVAVDRAGRVYVVGTTDAADFPITPRAAQRTLSGSGSDAYVMAFAPGGHRLLYSTYLGGRTEVVGLSIAADKTGAAYITGLINTEDLQHVDFPTTARAFSRSRGGAFVTKLSPDGGRLLYSTLLGDDSDAAYDIAVDGDGHAYVTGRANLVFGAAAPRFFTTPGAFQRTPDPRGNAFVAKFAPDGSHLVYSTLLGGQDAIGIGIAVDGGGHAYVTGDAQTNEGSSFPTTPGAYSQRGNLFAAELAPDGRSLVYSTRLGGVSYVNNPQRGRQQPNDPGGIAIDGAGNTYVTGSTVADDFPLTPRSYRRPGHGYVFPGGVFVVKLAPGGHRVLYSVRFGGDTDSSSENNLLYQYDDRGRAVAVDTQGEAYVTGDVNSTNFPTTPGAYARGRGGAFVTKLSADGSRIVYSTRLGGEGSYDSSVSDTNPKGLNALINDAGNDIALDAVGHAYVTGTDTSTTRAGFPTTPGALRTSADLGNAAFNGFLAELSPDGVHLLYSTLLGGNK